MLTLNQVEDPNINLMINRMRTLFELCNFNRLKFCHSESFIILHRDNHINLGKKIHK